MLLGALLVAAAVLASLATEPVVSLMGRDLSGGNPAAGVGVTVFNLVMFAVAHLVPPFLVAAGIALPLVGIYQYREAMLSPRRRGVSMPGTMPVGAGRPRWAGPRSRSCWSSPWWASSPLNPRERTDDGLAEPFLIYEEPPYFVPD